MCYPFSIKCEVDPRVSISKSQCTLYRQLVGSLIYLTHNQTNIYFVSVVSCFVQDPRESHWKAEKCIIHYIEGTYHFSIKYCQSLDSLVGFTYSYQVGDNDD